MRKTGICFSVFTVVLFSFTTSLLYAQQTDFKVCVVKLPPEVAYYDNQFSAMQVYDNKLFVIAESRLQDKADAKMYAASLSNLKKSLRDTSRVLPFSLYPISNLDKLRERMRINGDDYEGIEAAIFENDAVYLSIETATPSPNCYLLKGRLDKDALAMDTSFLVAIPKYTGSDGKAIFNAGYEAIVKDDDNLFAFYEYNDFPKNNFVKVLDKFSFTGNQCQHDFPIARLPFRITDITAAGNHHYTAINFFFKGDGEDAVYRPATDDSVHNRLVKENGQYKNYCRLVDLQITPSGINWQPLWQLPEEYTGHNWEAIAAYKKGYFLLNDKYTRARPYQSVLLYLVNRN